MSAPAILFAVAGLLALLSIIPATREYPLLSVAVLLASIGGFLVSHGH